LMAELQTAAPGASAGRQRASFDPAAILRRICEHTAPGRLTQEMAPEQVDQHRRQ